MKKKIDFQLPHGRIEGIYHQTPDADSPLVIITNGSNGFYNYGMFPYIQQKLEENGISSYSYNFSHGGIVGDADHFTELDLYEKNCMRLETADLAGIVRDLKGSEIVFTAKTKLHLLSHSLGGIPNVFAARELLAEGFKIDSLILVSSVKSLDRWPQNVIKEWEKKGVHYIKNNRTKQELPMGKELLEEVKQADGKWSMKEALKEVHTNIFIIHGQEDEAVSVQDAITINEWIYNPDHITSLSVLPHAGHTYGTKHPFQGTTDDLEMLIHSIIEWTRNYNVPEGYER